MKYSGAGFEMFIEKLRKAMNERIDGFERYMSNKFENNPHKTMVKSKVQWINEYKAWVKASNEVKQEILEYLLESERT